MNLKRRGNFAWLIALSVTTAFGCAGDATSDQEAVGDWGDESRYPDLGGAFSTLTEIDGDVDWVAATGVLTVDAEGNAQTVIIGKRAVDSAILVNGVPSGATASTLKRLDILGGANDQTVVLDFLNGVFGAGTTAARGITVDLGAGTGDLLAIRGSTTADTITFGANGIATGTDRNRDIDTPVGVELYTISLAGGNDVFAATGDLYGTVGVFTPKVTVFGSAGNDNIIGGDIGDDLWGGDGNDTLRGAGGVDVIRGDAGDDTFDMGPEPEGADAYACGDGTDTVSYALRTANLTLSVGGGQNDGEAGENGDVQVTCEILVGGTGNDTMTGDGNANTLNGGPGDDDIRAGGGNDVVNGGAGNDYLMGEGGDDVVNGNDGNDQLAEGTGANGADVFSGGAGTDLMDYGARLTAVDVTMDGVAANDGAVGENDNVKADIENINCGNGNDKVVGNALDNVMQGAVGNDDLSGGAGNDTFIEDTVAAGSDVYTGGTGVDTVFYGDRTTDLVITMGDGLPNDGATNENDNLKSDIENVVTGTGDDSITGNDLNNEIDAGEGEDTISGGAGDDTLDGGDTTDDNDLTCGAGDDIAFNHNGGTKAADCEI